jgi:cytochrome c biogenesis protein CcdA/thiol-disulfide isomerase/thioredoxin
VFTALLVLVFAAGALTILSPCVLPVIPLVFARAGRSFSREVLPMLVGLALTFAATASIATAGLSWLTRVGEAGRLVGIALLGLLGVSLIAPRVADILARPFVRLGSWIDARGGHPSTRVGRNLAIGAAIGLLWAPCAGPILGLVISTAALHGTSVATTALLFTFALGASTSLAIGMLAGRRVLARIYAYLPVERSVRRVAGVATLGTLFLIASGRDAQLFAGTGPVDTGRIEQQLLTHLHNDEGVFPGLAGATGWINTAPLTAESLKGKVILVNFWTFSCYNCLNALPHIKAIEAKYRDRGLVVLGIHTPELAHERVESNVRDAVRRLGIVYPVVLDQQYAIWNAFHNEYWPSVYIIDAQGHIRYHHFGEGDYDGEDRAVDALLREAAAHS